MIDKLTNNPVHTYASSIYDYNELSLQELLSKFFNKINECVDTSNIALQFLEWLKGEGLQLEVVKEIELMYADGRLTEIINKLSNDVKGQVTSTNRIVEELKSSTNSSLHTFNTELVNKATKSEVDVERKRLDILEDTTTTTLTNINSDLENKASKLEVDVERKRIDSLSKLGEGSTTGDAELIDARISQSGKTYSNVGENIRNIDSLLTTSVLSYDTIVNYNYEQIVANRYSNGMLYVKYNIKKGDIFEIETEVESNNNNSVTFTKAIPIIKTMSNVEVINTNGSTIGKRVIATDNFNAIQFWSNDVTKLRKVIVKKINYKNELLRTSKIGVLDDLFKKTTILNSDIGGLTSNLKYEPVKIKKGCYYRINVRTNVKNKYSISATIVDSKVQTETIIIADTTEDTTDYIFYADKNYNYIRVYEEKNQSNNVHLIIEEIDLTFANKGKYERIIYIAGHNSSEYDKANADLVCTGTNDELVINKAVASLPYGGTIQLFDGEYNFDSFSTMNNSCVFFHNTGYGRTITIRGTTENKSFLSNYGVVINVTEKAYSTIKEGMEYSVFNGDSVKLPIHQVEVFANNVNFENFYLFLYNSQKKVIGINGSNFGSMEVNQVGVYHRLYFYYRFNRVRPETPVEGCIGILSVKGANDEMARISMDCANSGGLWCGIKIKNVEHLIMNTCTSSRSVYGYIFEGRCDKTLTVINCADEGNRHLPLFKGTGSSTIIDFCIERLHDDVIPFNPNGNLEPLATEDTTNGWKGSISYRIQGNALNVFKFWKDGHGRGFKTVNLDNNLCGTTRPSNPDFLCEFFDTTSNKMLRWNGTKWVDPMGNIV